MNIAKLKELIPADFEYKYLDADNVEQVEQITLSLKRMSFSVSTSKAFREAMENEDSAAISDILTGLIADWNIDANGEPFAPTAENISACPADFVGKLAECVFKRLFANPQTPLPSESGSEAKGSTEA